MIFDNQMDVGLSLRAQMIRNYDLSMVKGDKENIFDGLFVGFLGQ
jgi:hypothetical protein